MSDTGTQKEAKSTCASWIKKKAEKIEEKALGIFVSLRDVYLGARGKTDKALRIKNIYFDARFGDVRELLYSAALDIINEIRPRNGSGRIVYGTGDPGSSASFFEAAAFFYPFYGDHVDIVPVMDGQALSVDLDIQGRIYIFVLVKDAVRILASKNARKMYKLVRRILDE